jgi:hypothetical protein
MTFISSPRQRSPGWTSNAVGGPRKQPPELKFSAHLAEATTVLGAETPRTLHDQL